MDRMMIQFETGFMVLNVRTFFPTTERKSKRIAKFICDNCPKKEVAELIKELCDMEEGMRLEGARHQDMIPQISTSTGKAFHARQVRVANSLKKRIERDRKNIEEEMNGKI